MICGGSSVPSTLLDGKSHSSCIQWARWFLPGDRQTVVSWRRSWDRGTSRSEEAGLGRRESPAAMARAAPSPLGGRNLSTLMLPGWLPPTKILDLQHLPQGRRWKYHLGPCPKLQVVIPKKGNAKECSNCCTVVLISHASKVMLKIGQARLQQYGNCQLLDVPIGFRKGRGTRDQIANICWIVKKAREFQKNIYFCFIDYAKAFECGKFFKRWEYHTWPASWETYMQVRKQHLELDMEQQTGSK